MISWSSSHKVVSDVAGIGAAALTFSGAGCWLLLQGFVSTGNIKRGLIGFTVGFTGPISGFKWTVSMHPHFSIYVWFQKKWISSKLFHNSREFLQQPREFIQLIVAIWPLWSPIGLRLEASEVPPPEKMPRCATCCAKPRLFTATSGPNGHGDHWKNSGA